MGTSGSSSRMFRWVRARCAPARIATRDALVEARPLNHGRMGYRPMLGVEGDTKLAMDARERDKTMFSMIECPGWPAVGAAHRLSGESIRGQHPSRTATHPCPSIPAHP